MRLAHIGPLLCLTLFSLSACAEQAVCAEGRLGGRDTVVVECSTGKVPACGEDPATLYDPATGALLPTPEAPNLGDDAMRRAFNGSCSGITGPCRPRPTCQGAAGDAPACATGQTAFCVLGNVDEIEPPVMPTDSGPPMPRDAGDGDAGDGDAGAAGTDAGTDAATASDAGTDAG